MSSTTVKLDHDLVEKVSDLKQREQSISAFVRALIEKEFRDRRLREAARTYEQFLQENPAEREAMEVWEGAPLTDGIEPKKP
jgi:hypothetical protein